MKDSAFNKQGNDDCFLRAHEQAPQGLPIRDAREARAAGGER